MQKKLSTQALIKVTAIALLVSALALMIIILPAEYNIDATGIGEKLGLTVLANPIAENIVNTGFEQTSQIIEITVPAERGVEFKFSMLQHQKMQYEWQTDGEVLYFDLHGEPEGDTTGYFESYAIATLSAMKGSFTAPFSGSHGWYWKNKSSKPVQVKLTVTGEYRVIGLKK